MTRTRMPRTILPLLVLALTFGAAAAVSAHEGHHHEARGTLKAIDAEKLDLTATDGAERRFVVSGTTKFLRGTKEIPRSEVAAGERAVVMYETKEGADRAIEVRLAERKP